MATVTELRPAGETIERAKAPNHRLELELKEIVAPRAPAHMYVWAALRLGMGWIFLWAFIDKVFGLGFATKAAGAWLNGGSPTLGFLKFGTKGPFADLYQAMAGNAVVDWLFMLGLLAIGLPLVLGIGVRIAAGIGVIMLALMYTAGFLPPKSNPFLDQHVIYAVIMIGLILARPGHLLGLGGYWARTRLVKRYPILE